MVIAALLQQLQVFALLDDAAVALLDEERSALRMVDSAVGDQERRGRAAGGRRSVPG